MMNEWKKLGKDLASVVVVITAAFVILRLFGFIHWKWYWLISPVWITIALIIVAAIIRVAIPDRHYKK